MLRIYTCLTQEHDPWLLLLAVLVCGLGSFATARLLTHARQHREAALAGGPGSTRLQARGWLLACAVAGGSAIWSTHFIAMLAFQPQLQAGYEPWRTVGSLLLAIAVMGVGCGIVVAARRRPAHLLAGGLVIGLGIGSMHFTGMAAFQVAGHLVWDAQLHAASWALGLGFAAAAMLAQRLPPLAARLAVPGLLVLAIAGLHFTAMAAVTVFPDPTRTMPPRVISGWLLAGLVAQASLLILALSAVGLLLDLRERRRAAAESDRIRALADAAVEGLVVTDAGTIVAANSSFRALAGLDAAAIEGRALAEFLPDAPAPDPIDHAAPCETVLHRPDGSRCPVELVRRPIRFEGRACDVAAVRDLTARKEAERRIAFLAHHDALTGAPNRVAFNAALQRELALARRLGRATAVLLIDLDRFKLVNDSLGHAMGDALLVRVHERLAGALRETDLAARLGGDEFAVLQADAAQPRAAGRLAARIVELLGRPFLVQGHVLNIGASIGVAIAPADADEAGLLLKQADLALYHAKATGRGSFRMFEGSMDRDVQARRLLELDLRRAAARGEFEIHYQPLLDMTAQAITGFEALLRWRHPERGLVPPADFIPLAEETGLIGPIGDWVLQTACRDAAGWPGALSVAVNLSPAQFRDTRLVESVTAALAEAGLPPARLEVEITESVLLADNPAVLQALHALPALGVRIAMDDFGTGYSSLSYLRSFPFDKIKIDRPFVRDVQASDESAAIVRAILSLGRTLGLTTTAEGVETDAQLQYVREHGCDQAQGYLVDRPLAPADMARLLARLAPQRAA
jgi:diguanylate cyclase (GGDEF)-like protein/PAS domain S-box-containing protein